MVLWPVWLRNSYGVVEECFVKDTSLLDHRSCRNSSKILEDASNVFWWQRRVVLVLPFAKSSLEFLLAALETLETSGQLATFHSCCSCCSCCPFWRILAQIWQVCMHSFTLLKRLTIWCFVFWASDDMLDSTCGLWIFDPENAFEALIGTWLFVQDSQSIAILWWKLRRRRRPLCWSYRLYSLVIITKCCWESMTPRPHIPADCSFTVLSEASVRRNVTYCHPVDEHPSGWFARESLTL